MKKLMIIAGILLSGMVQAQQNAIENIFKTFDGKDGITTIQMSPDLMKMASNIDTSDKDLNSALGMISEVRIIALEKASSEDKVTFKNMVKSIETSDYKVLMTIKEKNNDIKLLSKGNNNMISEFLMIVSGDNSPALIYITGNIELSKLSKMAGKVHLQGFEHLAKLEHKKS